MNSMAPGWACACHVTSVHPSVLKIEFHNGCCDSFDLLVSVQYLVSGTINDLESKMWEGYLEDLPALARG